MTILAFHGDFDRLQAALMVALGAAASGLDVSVYFSFWAVLALKQKRTFQHKNWLAKLLTFFLPTGPSATSRLNFCGAGPLLFTHIMKQKGIPNPTELLALAIESGVRLVVCPTSMEMMGIAAEELIPGTEIGGVACFVQDAAASQVNLVF